MIATHNRIAPLPYSTRPDAPVPTSVPDPTRSDMGFSLRAAHWAMQAWSPSDPTGRRHAVWRYQQTLTTAVALGLNGTAISSLLHPDCIANVAWERQILPEIVRQVWDATDGRLQACGSDRSSVLGIRCMPTCYILSVDHPPRSAGDAYIEMERIRATWDDARIRLRVVGPHPDQPHLYGSDPLCRLDPVQAAQIIVDRSMHRRLGA